MATVLGRKLRLRHHGCVNDEFEASFLESPLIWSESRTRGSLDIAKDFPKKNVLSKFATNLRSQSQKVQRQLGGKKNIYSIITIY